MSELDETLPLSMVPILPQYNAVLKGELSPADQRRLLRLKRAADSVYSYYDWVATDFRRVENSVQHTARIEDLLQEVMGCLELSQFEKSLAGYFTICVLMEIKEEFMAGGPAGTNFPINVAQLQEVAYNSEDIIDAAHRLDDAQLMYIAGIFIPTGYELDDTMAVGKATILRGAPVYSDDVLTVTDSLFDLVESYTNEPYSSADEDTHFPAFVKALSALYTLNDDQPVQIAPEDSPQ